MPASLDYQGGPADGRIMDHVNSVELLGTYGGDLEHALSAWCSTGRELTDERRARIPAMLKQLAEAGHHTPFEKSMLHFLVTCDTATHIHILKHRIGVSTNGESARYKELKDKCYLPTDWPPEEQLFLLDWLERGQANYHAAVGRLTPILGRKRAKESARFYLPYANQLTLDVSFNFRSLMHFMGLRNSPDAQLEVREIAKQMLELVHGTEKFTESLRAFGL